MLGWCSEEQYVNAFMNAVSTVYMYVNICVCTIAMLHKSKASYECKHQNQMSSIIALLRTVCMVQDGCLEIDGTKMASGSV